jgi:hypothetical protein
MTSRKATNELIELCEAGILDWETVARESLFYMGESEVERTWGIVLDLLGNEEEEKEEEEDEGGGKRSIKLNNTGTEKPKQYYTVSDIKKAGFNLGPLKCVHCGSGEVTYHQASKDAYCAECGNWQELDI